MYCSNCGYDLTEKKIKSAKMKKNKTNTRDMYTKDVYVCPCCGHLIKDNFSEEDIKALSRASHSEIHRSRNNINSGMCFLMITIILAVIAAMFFAMSFKAAKGGALDVGSTEFYVCIALAVASIATLGYSIFNLVRGIKKNKKYTALLKDIQNNVFVQ